MLLFSDIIGLSCSYKSCFYKKKSSSDKTLPKSKRLFQGKIVISNCDRFISNVSLCKAEDETYIHLFYRCRKTSIFWRQLQEFFSTTPDLPSISPQSAIFDFLDDALEHEFLLNHILLIFKNYLYKARENKDLNFNILKNYLTKIRDLEANLKDNDIYNKKWTVISNML